MKQDIMHVGIIGAGRIAGTAANTLNQLPTCKPIAIGSRSQEKADAFAAQWGIDKAYGSYADLIADPDVDLIYVATPHSHHYDVTREALLAGKPCLVEKSFMANARQAQDIINLAHQQKVFLAEAMWTRYQPAAEQIRQLLAEGVIGEPKLITATLAYPISHKPRITQPDYCGGALLDLGVYALNFVRMFCPADVLSIDSHCVKNEWGVDLTETISLSLAGDVMADVQSSIVCTGNNVGVIAGTKAHLVVDNINNPQRITVNTREESGVIDIKVPQQITGYEYEFLTCRQALLEGRIEPVEMPHDETLYIMRLMDELRSQWGVRFPMDNP